MLKPLQKFILPVFLLTLSGLKAQTLNFTSTPVTNASENVSYSCPISATIDNNDELSFSTPTLPSWLTMSMSGATSSLKVTDSVFVNPGGVAGDAEGNYYVYQNDYGMYSEASYSRIYKITPDRKATLWATITHDNNNMEYGYSWSYCMIIVDHYLYVSLYNGYYENDNPAVIRLDMTQENPQAETVYSNSYAGILSMTYHDGYIYTANYWENKIGRIKVADNSYSDYVTNINGPFGLGFTPDGTLLIASYIGGKVVKYVDGQLSDAITGMSYPSDVKIDKNGYVYVSSATSNIRKYAPDLNSYTEIQSNGAYIYSMTLTPNGALVYSDIQHGYVYALQTGATLTGTPGHEHVGVHPVKVTVTNGSVSKDLEFSITVTDPNPPVVETYLPANNSSAIALDSTLHLEFSETIEKGSGKIFIKAKSDNSVLKTFDISSSSVTINDSVLSVKLGSKLPYLTEVYVEIETGAIKDVNDNDYVGISGASGWAYTTVEQTQEEQTILFAETKTVSYGDEDFAPGATTNAELEITYTSSDESIAEVVNGKIHIKKPGVINITAQQEGNENYFAATPVTQELTIKKKEIEVVLLGAPSITKVYDGTRDILLAEENYQLQGIVEGDEVKVSGLAKFADANAGSEKIISVHSLAIGGEDKDKYQLTAEETTVTGSITPKKIQVVASNTSKVYGAADGDFSYEVEGLLNEDHLTGSLSREVGKNVGEYDIQTGSLSAGNNYEIEFTGATFTITPANLVIKAEDKTKQQGKSNPSFTFSYQGLVNGDSPSSLLTQPQAKTLAEDKSPIGYYDIEVQGAASPNYNISYTKGRLSVVPGESSRVKAWSSSPSVLNVRIYAETAQKSALVLFTDAGQTIVLQRHQLNAGVNDFTINVSSLTPNIYVLHVNADKFKESQRVKIK